MKYFEDFEPGMTASASATYLVSEEEIIEVGERWDPQPYHVDRAAAAESIFGGLVASSAHIFAIYTWFAHQLGEPTASVSALGFDESRWHAPVRGDDRISYRDTCTGARISRSRPGLGILEFHSELINQRGELVFSTRSAALVRQRPA